MDVDESVFSSIIGQLIARILDFSMTARNIYGNVSVCVKVFNQPNSNYFVRCMSHRNKKKKKESGTENYVINIFHLGNQSREKDSIHQQQNSY